MMVNSHDGGSWATSLVVVGVAATSSGPHPPTGTSTASERGSRGQPGGSWVAWHPHCQAQLAALVVAPRHRPLQLPGITPGTARNTACPVGIDTGTCSCLACVQLPHTPPPPAQSSFAMLTGAPSIGWSSSPRTSCPGRISLVYSLLHRWPCRLRYSAPNTGTVVSLLAAQCLGTRHPAQWRWYTHDLSPSADSRFWSPPFAFVLVLMFRGSSPIAVVPPHAELVCVAVRVVASSPW